MKLESAVEKPTFSTRSSRGVTRDAEDYARVARTVFARLQQHSIKVHPASRVARMIELLEEWGRVQNGQAGGDQRLFEIVHDCQLDVLQWEAITSLLDRSPRTWDALIGKALSGNLEPELDAAHCAGRNTQFELYVASDLASAGVEVGPGEPDLLASFRRVTFGVACKRLSSVAALDRALRDANRQISRTGLHGWIALDASVYFLERGRVAELDRPHDGLYQIPQYLTQFVADELVPRVEQLERTCFGVLCFVLLKTAHRPKYFSTWIGCRMLPNRREGDLSMAWVRRLGDAMQAAALRLG